ncbi:hypothetical protein AURDEDRAFT_178418 [Auricularia subglabra TFB-10046 SS5]|uniref:Uncharacterized protein n=1 Tax=Auricularia subglabra (strain TFB-10046 / SS5) TaxID=717982 RepID=J0CQM3_AURST|nr:hypothetical protein AURDEDRAFT_178418 [Auricularia subglabra TFB-10046 SS5]
MFLGDSPLGAQFRKMVSWDNFLPADNSNSPALNGASAGDGNGSGRLAARVTKHRPQLLPPAAHGGSSALPSPPEHHTRKAYGAHRQAQWERAWNTCAAAAVFSAQRAASAT